MTVDRHIFSEWFKAFILALAVTLGILLLEDINDDLPDFIAYGASPLEIARYYLLLTPTFLPLLVPISLMISLLFSMGNLHRNNEIIAMRTAGLSLFRITRTLWLASALLSALLLWLSAERVPVWMEQSRTLRDNLQFAEQATRVNEADIGVVNTVAFENAKDGRLWLMNRFSEYTLQGFGINVYMRDDKGREYGRIMAREGYFDDTKGYWVFTDGREFTFNPKTREAIRALPFDKKAFPEFTESPVIMKMLGKEPKSLSMFELRELLDKVPPEENPNTARYAVRYQSILSIPFSCFIVAGIAIPFAIGGPRTNPMVGVAKSFGLFALYYVIDGIAALFGGQQLIGPVIAAWVPNAVMITSAAILMWQKR